MRWIGRVAAHAVEVGDDDASRGRRSATSPSSRKITSRVWARTAATSEARKFSPSPTPTMRGTFRRAPDQPPRLALVEHRDRVGALGLAQRGAQRVRDIARVRLLHEVREDLGVGLGVEAVAARRELVAQVREVLDDAVVDDRDLARAVHVGMGVEVVGPAVGRPAGVREAHAPHAAWRPASAARRLAACRPASPRTARRRRSRARCPPSRSRGTRGAPGRRAGWAPRRAARCSRRCRTCASLPPAGAPGPGRRLV